MFIFNDHRKLEGKHAYLGCSQSAWENRTDEQLVQMYYSKFATDIGTAIHEFAQYCINMKMKLRKTDDHMIDFYLQVVWPMKTGTTIPIGSYDSKSLIETVSLFVNDALGYRLKSEVILSYDDTYAFGTSDALGIDEKNKIIRVHDLKTGVHPVKMTQLLLYAAYLCLEYKLKPREYSFELRVYQSGEIVEYFPTANEIEDHMRKISHATDILVNNIERI